MRRFKVALVTALICTIALFAWRWYLDNHYSQLAKAREEWVEFAKRVEKNDPGPKYSDDERTRIIFERMAKEDEAAAQK